MNTSAVFHTHPGERPHAKVEHYDGTHAIIVFFDHTDAGSYLHLGLLQPGDQVDYVERLIAQLQIAREGFLVATHDRHGS